MSSVRVSNGDILQWKVNRQTTEEEDMANCLLGIFDVSMPLIYREGYERAMKRLLREAAESGRIELQPSVKHREISLLVQCSVSNE